MDKESVALTSVPSVRKVLTWVSQHSRGYSRGADPPRQKTWTGLESLSIEWKGIKSCYWAVFTCTRLHNRFSRVSHRAFDKDSFENIGKLLLGKKGGGVGINQGILRSLLKLFTVTCSKKTRKSSETSFFMNHTTMVQISQLESPFPRKASGDLSLWWPNQVTSSIFMLSNYTVPFSPLQ